MTKMLIVSTPHWSQHPRNKSKSNFPFNNANLCQEVQLPQEQWSMHNLWEGTISKRATNHMNKIEQAFRDIRKEYPELQQELFKYTTLSFIRTSKGFHEINSLYEPAKIRTKTGHLRRDIKYAVYAMYLAAWATKDLDHTTMAEVKRKLGMSIRADSVARQGIFQALQPTLKLLNKEHTFRMIILSRYLYED